MTRSLHIPGIARSAWQWGLPLLLLSLCVPSIGLAQGPPPDIGFDQKLGDQIPLDLKLTNQNGDLVELRSYFGKKPVVLVPVYYKCPMLCGLELNGLVRCLRALDMTVDMKAKQDFEILTFSFDPRESSELASRKRKQYLAQYGCPEAEDGWHFMTGDEETLKTLCNAIGFRAKYDEVSGDYAHAAGIVVCTPDGVISRYLYGVEFAPKDLRLAVLESGQGKVGSLAEHILMFCYRYDPTQGKYGLAILNLLRASGVLTVLILAGGVGWMLKRDRNAARHPGRLEGARHG
jgi:protein SCO1/2